MTERNDQWSWDGVNSPYNEAQQPGQYGAAPTPYGGGQSPYGDQPDGAPTPPHHLFVFSFVYLTYIPFVKQRTALN